MDERECAHCGRLLNEKGYCWWCQPHLASPPDPTPTGAAAVPVAELRILVARWRTAVAPDRVGSAPTGPMSGVVAATQQCAADLDQLLARHDPDPHRG